MVQKLVDENLAGSDVSKQMLLLVVEMALISINS